MSVSDWLRAETPKHCALLTRLREQLEASLDDNLDEQGAVTRDWLRGARTYQTGYQALLVEERERAKLSLLAKAKGGPNALSDEDFERELMQLGIDALAQLPLDALYGEFLRRGAALPVGAAAEDGEDS